MRSQKAIDKGKEIRTQQSKELPPISEEPGQAKHDYEQFDDFELPDDKDLQLREFSKNQTLNVVAANIAHYNVGRSVAE